jgi:hypothetical protein
MVEVLCFQLTMSSASLLFFSFFIGGAECVISIIGLVEAMIRAGGRWEFPFMHLLEIVPHNLCQSTELNT